MPGAILDLWVPAFQPPSLRHEAGKKMMAFISAPRRLALKSDRAIQIARRDGGAARNSDPDQPAVEIRAYSSVWTGIAIDQPGRRDIMPGCPPPVEVLAG
jgi:hypothetical protein